MKQWRWLVLALMLAALPVCGAGTAYAAEGSGYTSDDEDEWDTEEDGSSGYDEEEYDEDTYDEDEGDWRGTWIDDHTIEAKVYPSTNDRWSGAASENYYILNSLLEEPGELTIIIPPGSNIRINGKLNPTSNKTIIATGATITMKPKTYVMMTDPTKGIHDLTVIGGKWRSPDEGGRKGSMFQLAFAKNVTLDGVDVEANFTGHCVEIIASENVTVKNCTIRAVGSNPKNCKEEQIQIDVSTKKTAPKVAAYGSKWVQGQTCKNIYLLNNKVYGARAIGANYHSSMRTKYHRNVVIKNNVIHATTSEAIQYFNVVGGEISGNKIRTDATRKTSNMSYTIAVHIQNNGAAPADMASSKIEVKNNTVYGNRNGIYVKGCRLNKKTSGKFGTVVIQNNTVYCKKGKKAGVAQTKGSCRKWTSKGNKTYKWTKSTKVPFSLK